MRGIGSAFSRLPAARLLIAGAAMLAGAVAPAAYGQAPTEDVALFAPRLSIYGASLPQPLTPGDAAHLRRVFALEGEGDDTAARAEAAEVASPLLLGPMLASRYLGGKAQPTANELADWLARYADLPDAPAIHAALKARLPLGATPPPAPAPQPPDAPAPPLSRNPALDRSIREPARAGRFDQALRLVAHTHGLGALYGAMLRGEVARAEFVKGNDAAALRLADAASLEAEGRVGLPAFVGGLAAWRLGRIDQARTSFEAASRAEVTTPVERSRAAFWAARAHLRLHDRDGYALWMQRAAEQPETFYGQLARHILGKPPEPAPFARAVLGEADVAAVDALPGGQRAFALLQIGQNERAAAELRHLWDAARGRPGLSRAIVLVARAAGLNDLVDELAPLLPGAEGFAAPTALPHLQPAGGFRIDPALVYALTRLESNFDPHAVSPSGASGLMQLMPLTAGWITGSTANPASLARQLHDPALNLELGQQYLVHLAGLDSVQGSLIRLLAAYNAGPASLAHWSETMKDAMKDGGDPLLFIESIPNDETRAYVPRALAYTWLYAAHLSLPTPSLDALAAGHWPRFDAGAPASLVNARLH
jgi:soluble lytic murein transglycosylase